MPNDELHSNYKSLSNADLILKLGASAETQKGIDILHPFPKSVPGPDQLDEVRSNLNAAVNAAVNFDRQKIAERDLLKEKAATMLTFNAQYCVMVAFTENRPDLLGMCGHEFKKRTRSVSTSSAVLHTTPVLSVSHGPVSGTVLVSSTKVKGAVMGELQVSTQDPQTEESWMGSGLHTNLKHLELKNLEVPKKHFLRLRYHGRDGVGPWSATVSIIVV